MDTTSLRGQLTSYSLSMVTEVCITCGIPFMFPQNYKEHLKRTHECFYCPNGHSQYYPAKSDAEILKEKLRERENELAQKHVANIQLENQLDKANKKLKKVAEGKCPCCDKTFKHLANHMKNKHPNGK